MAGNDTLFRIVFDVEGSPQLQRVGKVIDDQNKKIDKNTKSKKQSEKQSKRNQAVEKSLYQTTLNSTKGFSKQARAMGGSSGLVAAYATLAANVFAATAAFSALQRAAQFEQLTKGLTELGHQSGRTLSIMAQGLRDVTGGAISAEESMRAAALGVSGGFGGEQLAGLAKIARGASITLGRSLPDAFDRLTRGAIKLEPEILDELGIMVRLDDAVENYGAQIGKAGGALTQMERRQAFMNAILEQGESKFGEIAEAVEPDAYSRLGATFADLTKAIFDFFNTKIFLGFGGLNDVVGFLADNVGALAGVMVLFGSTIAAKMIPAIGDAAGRSMELASTLHDVAVAAEGVSATAKTTAFSKLGGKGVSDPYKKLAGTLDVSKDNMSTLNNMQRSLSGSVGYHTKMVNKGTAAQKTASAARLTQLKQEQFALNSAILMEKQRGAAILASKNALALSNAQAAVSVAIMEMHNKGVKGGAVWATLAAQTKIYTSTLLANAGAHGVNAGAVALHTKALMMLKGAAFFATNAMRILMNTLLGLIAPIGVLIVGAAVLYAAWQTMWNTDEQKAYKKGLEELNTLFEELEEKVKKYNKALDNSKNAADGQLRAFEIQSGLLTEINNKLQEQRKLRDKANESRADWMGDISLGEADPSMFISRRGKENVGADMAKELGLDSDFFTAIDDGGKALRDALAINKSVEFQTMANMLKNGIPKQAEVLKEKLKLIWAEDMTPKQQVDAIAKAIGEVDVMFGGLGPAAKGLRDALKESEKEGSKFLSTFAKKTSVDMFAKSTSTGVKAIKSLGDAAKEAGENVDITLGKALLDVGSKTASMIGPEFQKAQQTLIKATRDLDIAKKKSLPEEEISAFKAIQEQAAAELGKMVGQYENLNKEVLKTQRLEITRKRILDGINKTHKFAAANYKKTSALAGTENKMLLKKLKFEKEIVDAKVQQLKNTFKELEISDWDAEGNRQITTMGYMEFMSLSLNEQLAIIEKTTLQNEQLFAVRGAAFDAEMKQIAINHQGNIQSASAALQLLEYQKQRLELKKKENNLLNESENLEARRAAYVNRGGMASELKGSEEAELKINAAVREFELKKDSIDMERRMIGLRAQIQKMEMIKLGKEIQLHNQKAKDAEDFDESDLIQFDVNQATTDIDHMAKLQKKVLGDSLENLRLGVQVAMIDGIKAYMDDALSGDITSGEANVGISELERRLTNEEKDYYDKTPKILDKIVTLWDKVVDGTPHELRVLVINTEDFGKQIASEINNTVDTAVAGTIDDKVSEMGVNTDKVYNDLIDQRTADDHKKELINAQLQAQAATTGRGTDVGGREEAGPPSPKAQSAAEVVDEKKAATYANVMRTMTLANMAFSNTMKDFGPEGEAYAAMMDGIFNNESGLIANFKKVGGAGNDVVKRLSAVGAVVGSLRQIQDQSSKSAVAGIDSQIAAEKARDGQSKESLEKIKSLEQKKIAMQKKAFETKKKLAIAETMINITTAVVQAWRDYGWPMGAILGAIIAAMGMKQIAMIRSQKFSGGSGAAEASKPSGITVGSRDNKVDVSKKSNAGELAYLTGQKGIGKGANSFTPMGGAAGLKKGYADGGVVVGERGPEVITPTTGFNVTPNDELGGTIVNANFTIQAIDAAGVEEVLLGQQGNIISMIRSAANEYGEEFIESVNTEQLSAASGGDY